MISIIVCTYNREQYIGDCILHLAKQTAAPKDYEVIVVDNSSTDRSSRIIRQMIEECGTTQIAYYLEEAIGLSHARNRGIKESSGDILAFLDDDAFADVKYVDHLADYFTQHPEVMAVGGKITPQYETDAPKWMSTYLLPLVAAVDLGDKSGPYPKNKFPIGANMAFRSSVFEQLGGFDPELGRIANELGAGEEKELFLKLKSNQSIIHYVPGALVRHIIPEKRLEEDYIRRMGQGVGNSEKRRLRGKPFLEKGEKMLSELIKVAGTLLLFLAFNLQGRPQAALMLVKFRFWVLQGYLQ